MGSTIHIACAIDIGYIQHLGVMLCSLFENNKQSKFYVYAIIDFEENKDYRNLEKLVKSYCHVLQFIKVDGEKLNGLVISDHATTAVYYRLLLPQLLDTSITKILYLDSDIIVKKSLKELWETDIGSVPVAAVEEPLFNRHEQLGLPMGAPYFNSGVLLVNLTLWREMKVSEKAFTFIEENPDKIHFWDQDALNVVLVNNWKKLHPKWNQQTVHFEAKELGVTDNTILECLNTPTIIHYSSKFKPWSYLCTHPQKGEYFYYLKFTPWKGFKIAEHSFWHIIKQNTKRFINSLLGRKVFEVYA